MSNFLVDELMKTFEEINIDPKKVSDIDEGFLESCIEQDVSNVGVSFLQNIYKYSYNEALAYMVKVTVKVLRRK